MLQVASLPLVSMAVRVTVFSPMFEQSKVVISADLVAIAQLSDHPANKSSSLSLADVSQNISYLDKTWLELWCLIW